MASWTHFASLKQLRAAIHGEFRIAAVTWPGDTEKVAQTLSVSDDSVLKLSLLSRVDILEIVKAAGIGGYQSSFREPSSTSQVVAPDSQPRFATTR